MATRRTGPVKPPVLDMEARKNPTDAKPGPADKKPAPKTPFWNTLPLVPLATGLIGAIAGLLLAYLVAVLGFWPQPALTPDTAGAEIARLSADVKTLTTAQNTLKSELASAQQALEDKIQTQMNQTTAELDQLKATPSSTGVTPADLEALKADLTNRINAISTGASPEQADQLAAELKSNAEIVADLSSRLSAIETARAAAPRPADRPAQPSAQLPLALAGFEAALRTGHPFNAELTAITTALPSLTTPPNLLQNAQTGLTPPSAIAEAFNTAIPNLLAAIPAKPDANLQERLIEQAKSLLALRPVGPVSGDSPEALIARLEAALAVPDFATAQTLVETLPSAMRQLIPTIADDIAAHAEAEAFVATARSAALTPAAPDAQTPGVPAQ